MKNLIAVLLIFSLITPSVAERAKEFIGKKFTNYTKSFPLNQNLSFGSILVNSYKKQAPLRQIGFAVKFVDE